MQLMQLQHPIRVIGVGGGGSNAVDRMIQVGVSDVDFVVANTDIQALQRSEGQNQIHLGPRITRGLGAGANPEIGARAVSESVSSVKEACEGAELVFITAGMGGGTGSGAAPAIARTARGEGAIVVGVVTMPFSFEGTRRRQNAEKALETLKDEVDTIVVVYNDRLLKILDPQHARLDIAFRVADECLRQAVAGITGIIQQAGLINLDFADVKAVLRDGGFGHFSIGYGRGDDAAQDAMRRALASPLLGRDGIEGARSVLVNFRSSGEMSLLDMDAAACTVRDLADENANIFYGTSVDPSLGDQVEVILMAVGLEPDSACSAAQAPQPRPVIMTIPARAAGKSAAPDRARTAPVLDAAPERPRHAPVFDNGYAAPDSPKTSTPPRAQAPVSAEQLAAVKPWQTVRGRYDGFDEENYSMDDLSVPAFIRRRGRKVSG